MRLRGALLTITVVIAVVPGPCTRHVPPTGSVPQLSHVVVVIMENHSYREVLGGSSAPYIKSLAASGATMTQSFATGHPSQPNYLQLFSGSTQGVTNDSCPHTFDGANLGAELLAAGRTFVGYSESMPSDGFTGCWSGRYARKHNPWVDFSNVPASSNLTFDRFPTTYSSLPTVSFVVPNLCNDMHDCSIATGDAWLRNHLDAYVQWAKTNDSALVLTFDEDDTSQSNQIATVFVGQRVKVGSYAEHVTHDNVLRTLEDMFGLPAAGASSGAAPIADIWTDATGT